MSSSIPPKGADIANEKLLEMGAGPSNNDTKSIEFNDHANSSLAGGITIGPPIAVKEVTK